MTKKPAQVFHFDLYGKREDKYSFLNENAMQTIAWKELKPQEPELFFVPKDFDVKGEYDKGFKVNELFTLNNVGIVTAREDVTITFSKKYLEDIICDFKNLEIEHIRKKYNISEDTRDWKISYAIADLKNNIGSFTKIACRPFDIRQTYYTGKTKGFYSYPRNEVMNNFINTKNIGLVVSKQASQGFKHIFITDTISNLNLTGTAGKFGAGYTMPLYLYSETTSQSTLSGLEQPERIPNLNPEIVKQIADGLGLAFVPEKETFVKVSNFDKGSFAPVDLLDYIYAVLHSATYREKYKEFLKIDFPRVPYPKDLSTFEKLTNLGGELRQIHLLESPTVEKYITQYPEDGDNVVRKPRFEINPVRVLNSDRVLGKVYINENQYFANVPEMAWNFYIGGYQPAQKWLKDRKDRELSTEDIFHYQKIIVALSETDRIMKQIDSIKIV